MPRIPGKYVESDEYSSSSSSSSSESDSDSVPNEPKVNTSQSPPAAASSASTSPKEKLQTPQATSDSSPTPKIEHFNGCHAKCNITNKLKSTFSCVICTDLYKDPYTLQCGHSFCFDCVYSWLSRKKQCPQCRSRIFRRPSRSFAIKEAIVCLLKADGKHHSEYSTQHSDMWDGLFGKDMTGGVIADTDDGIRRCANCAWEVVGNQCENCGMQFDPDDFDRGDDSYSLEAGSGVSSEDEYGFDEVYDDMNDDEEDTDLEGFVVGDDEIEIDEAASDWLDEISDDEFLDYTDEIALGLRPSRRDPNPVTGFASANLDDDSSNDNSDVSDDWRSDSPHDISDTPSSPPTELRFSDDENYLSNSAVNPSADVSFSTVCSVPFDLSRDGSRRGRLDTLPTANANPESDGPLRKRGRQILSDSDSDSDSNVVRHHTSKRPRVARISDESGSDDNLDNTSNVATHEMSSSSITAAGSTELSNLVKHGLPALPQSPSHRCIAAVSSMTSISMSQNSSPHLASKHKSPSTTKSSSSSLQGVQSNIDSHSVDHGEGMSIITAGDPAQMLNETVCRSKRKGKEKEKEIMSVQAGGTDESDTSSCGEDEVVPSAVIDASLMHQKKKSKRKRRKNKKVLHNECSAVSSRTVGAQSIASPYSSTSSSHSNPDRPLELPPSRPGIATGIMEHQDSKLSCSQKSLNDKINSSGSSSSGQPSVPINSIANKPERVQNGDSYPDEPAQKSKKKGKRPKKHRKKGKGKEKLEMKE